MTAYFSPGNWMSLAQAQQAQTVDYAQRAYGAGMAYPYSSGNVFVGLTSGVTTTDNTTRPSPEKIIEPPDEFTQLSNHKFHELLAKFKETK